MFLMSLRPYIHEMCDCGNRGSEKYNTTPISFNPSMGTGNYSAMSNNMKLVHWPLMGGLLRLVQR